MTYNLQAATTYDTVNVTISGNTFTGWPAGSDIEDYATLSVGLTVANNTINP